MKNSFLKELNVISALGFLITLILSAISEISAIMIATKYLPLSMVLSMGNGSLIITYIIGIIGYICCAFGFYKNNNIIVLIGICSLIINCFFDLDIKAFLVIISLLLYFLIALFYLVLDKDNIKSLIDKLWFLPTVVYSFPIIASLIGNSNINILSILQMLLFAFCLFISCKWIVSTNKSIE